MLVAAGVVPCTPLLVPEVASGAAAELDGVRAAALAAIGVLAASRADRLVVVGPSGDEDEGPYPQGSAGSFRGFGVDLDVTLGNAPTAEAVPRLPASLAVGAWLLSRARWTDVPVDALAVTESTAPARAAAAGRELGASAARLALLVLGDGSACRTVKAPGYLDPRAEGFDDGVARSLGEAALPEIAALDAEVAGELKVSGRAPWQVLAGAAQEAGLDGDLLTHEAPYGVGYFVAAWS